MQGLRVGNPADSSVAMQALALFFGQLSAMEPNERLRMFDYLNARFCLECGKTANEGCVHGESK